MLALDECLVTGDTEGLVSVYDWETGRLDRNINRVSSHEDRSLLEQLRYRVTAIHKLDDYLIVGTETGALLP